MSVAVWDNQELRALGERLSEEGGVCRADVLEIVAVLGVANRAAYMMQYRDVTTIERPDLSAPITNDYSDWELKEWCQNLLYNCVTNAGVKFAPTRVQHEFEQIMVRAGC